ncbi:MAG: hypothetical protein ABIY62_00395 [Ginsengibacter sp.]
MREIKAFIRRNKVDEVVVALRNVGFISVFISHIEGTGTYTPISDVPIFNLPAIYKKNDKACKSMQERGCWDHYRCYS